MLSSFVIHNLSTHTFQFDCQKRLGEAKADCGILNTSPKECRFVYTNLGLAPEMKYAQNRG